MTLYDGSVLIDHLDGRDEAVAYVDDHSDERAVAPALVLFEGYQGEVFETGPADAVAAALEWLVIADETAAQARAAAEFLDDLRRRGATLAARDAFVAGIARGLDERLVVADADFDVDGIDDLLDVDRLAPERG